MNAVPEKELNLQIAKLVKEKLEEAGLWVVMTREDDNVPENKMEDMKNRVEQINAIEPSLVISIHQNSYSDRAVKGAQVFYYVHSSEGEALACALQEELHGIVGMNQRPAKSNDNYYMLTKTTAPTVIVECGFLSNEEEAEKLTRSEYQELLAESISLGVTKWLDKSKE